MTCKAEEINDLGALFVTYQAIASSFQLHQERSKRSRNDKDMVIQTSKKNPWT